MCFYLFPRPHVCLGAAPAAPRAEDWPRGRRSAGRAGTAALGRGSAAGAGAGPEAFPGTGIEIHPSGDATAAGHRRLTSFVFQRPAEITATAPLGRD